MAATDQSLSRLADPITHTQRMSVFHIEPEDNGLLRSDLKLHIGVTATTNAGQYTRFSERIGAYGLISEIRLIDRSGSTLYQLRNANRYAQLSLLKQSNDYSHDTERELSMTNRSFQQSAVAGVFARDPQNWYLTDDATTTAYAVLDLRKLVTLLNGSLPLPAMGRIRVEIEYEQLNSKYLENAAQVTGSTILAPQLSYTMIISEIASANVMAQLEKGLVLSFAEPVNVTNAIGAIDYAQINLGGERERVSEVFVAFEELANTIQAVALDSVTVAERNVAGVNLYALGKNLYPQDLGVAGRLFNLQKALQTPPSIPIAGYENNALAASTPIPAGQNYAGLNAFLGFSLRPYTQLPGSMENSTQLDAAGVQLIVRRSAFRRPALTVFAWLHTQREVVVNTDGVVH